MFSNKIIAQPPFAADITSTLSFSFNIWDFQSCLPTTVLFTATAIPIFVSKSFETNNACKEILSPIATGSLLK